LDVGDEVSIKLTGNFKGIDGVLNKVCNVLLHDGVLASKRFKCRLQVRPYKLRRDDMQLSQLLWVYV